MTIPCKSPFTVDEYSKSFVEILGMGEWAPLPPHESSGTPPLSPLKTPMVGGCEMLGGVMEKL